MHFTVNLNEIKNLTKTAIRGIAKKTENVDLLNFKLEAKDNKLQVTAINEYFLIKVYIEADIVEEGIVYVNAKLLEDILKNIKGKTPLTCEKKEECLEIRFENSTFKIKEELVSDYPEFPNYEEEDWYELEAIELIESAKQVGFSISSNEERPILENVFLMTNKNMLEIVSSDAYRISNKRKRLETCSKDESLMVKGDSIIELGRVLANYKKSEIKNKFRIGLSKKYMIVNLPNGVMLLTLMNGDYFNHKNFFKVKDCDKIAFDKEGMLEILKKGKSLAKGLKDKNPIVDIDIKKEGIKVSVDVQGSNISEMLNINILSEAFNGGVISFNLNYLNDGISSIQCDRILMLYDKQNTPSIFEGVDNREYRYMLMPVVKYNN